MTKMAMHAGMLLYFTQMTNEKGHAMANRDFNIPTGPDRTGGIDLQPIDFGDLPAASNDAQAGQTARPAAQQSEAAFTPVNMTPSAQSAVNVQPMSEDDFVEDNSQPDVDYEPGGISPEEASNQGLDDVQVSFLALRDSIGQSRELKSRERELEALRDQLDADREDLADRDDILANYQQRTAEQDAIVNQATQEREELRAQLSEATTRSEETTEALANMRNYHAEQIQPYEVELGRAQATADQAKNDERNRKSELNAAESELRRAEDERSSAMAQAKHQQVEAAYEEARARSEAAKDALAQAQQNFDELNDQFDQAEAPLERSIEDLEARIVELKDEIAQISDTIAEARKRRQFCDAVYQFPEETEKLRASVMADEETERTMVAENDELRAVLEQSKAKSKKAKIAIGIVIAIVVVILIAFIFAAVRGA